MRNTATIDHDSARLVMPQGIAADHTDADSILRLQLFTDQFGTSWSRVPSGDPGENLPLRGKPPRNWLISPLLRAALKSSRVMVSSRENRPRERGSTPSRALKWRP